MVAFGTLWLGAALSFALKIIGSLDFSTGTSPRNTAPSLMNDGSIQAWLLGNVIGQHVATENLTAPKRSQKG